MDWALCWKDYDLNLQVEMFNAKGLDSLCRYGGSDEETNGFCFLCCWDFLDNRQGRVLHDAIVQTRSRLIVDQTIHSLCFTTIIVSID